MRRDAQPHLSQGKTARFGLPIPAIVFGNEAILLETMEPERSGDSLPNGSPKGGRSPATSRARAAGTCSRWGSSPTGYIWRRGAGKAIGG